MNEKSASLKFLKLFLTVMGTPFTEAEIKYGSTYIKLLSFVKYCSLCYRLNQFAVSKKNLTSKTLGDLISKHYRHEVSGSEIKSVLISTLHNLGNGTTFSVIFGIDLIKKPVTAVIGGTKKIFQGAYEVYTAFMHATFHIIIWCVMCMNDSLLSL